MALTRASSLAATILVVADCWTADGGDGDSLLLCVDCFGRVAASAEGDAVVFSVCCFGSMAIWEIESGASLDSLVSEKCDALLRVVKVRKMGRRVRVCRVLKVGGLDCFVYTNCEY